MLQIPIHVATGLQVVVSVVYIYQNATGYFNHGQETGEDLFGLIKATVVAFDLVLFGMMIIPYYLITSKYEPINNQDFEPLNA